MTVVGARWTGALEAERRITDRRRRPTPVVSRYTLFGGRRAGDRRNPGSSNQYVDLYEPWVAACLIAIALLCALDAVFTLLYLQKGGEEANPLMASLIEWGPVPFVIVKCAVTNFGLGMLCLHKNFRWVRYVVGGLLGLYTILFAYHMLLAVLVK